MVGVSGVGAYFSGQCTALGMLIRFAGDMAMMSPPLIITVEEIHEVVLVPCIALILYHVKGDKLRTRLIVVLVADCEDVSCSIEGHRGPCFGAAAGELRESTQELQFVVHHTSLPSQQ